MIGGATGGASPPGDGDASPAGVGDASPAGRGDASSPGIGGASPAGTGNASSPADGASSPAVGGATHSYLTKPELARLWRAARETWERNGGLRGEARVPALSEAEAFELAGLIPRARRSLRAGDTLELRLVRLDERLRGSGLAASLRDALEGLGGPLRDRPAERAAASARWMALWEEALAHPASEAPEVTAWIERLRASGALKRAAPGAEQATLQACLDVLETLPRGGVELSRLASELLGDPHALDHDTALGGLLGAALAARNGRERPRSAAAWRQEWAAAGVVCDELSCNVLALGLRPVGPGAVAGSLRLLAEAGEPAVLTLRQLAREPPAFAPATAFVCENPAVVGAAAARFGGAAPVLVCTGGWPNTAAGMLLDRLADSRCELRYQGDFDRDGRLIANHLARRHGARGWRTDAATYLAAARLRKGRAPDCGVATGDGALAAAMRRERVAVYEEDVVGELLEFAHSERASVPRPRDRSAERPLDQ